MRKSEKSFKKISDWYESLSPGEATEFKNSYLSQFGCSAATFYRALKEEDPKVSFLKFIYNETGYCYNVPHGELIYDSQYLTQMIPSKYGLSLPA